MSETDEQRAYREERTEELVWERARALGMSRKRFLEVLASGAGAAVALGLGGRPAVAQQAQGHAPHFNQYANWFVKPTPAEYFIDHGHAKEMRWEVMKGRGYTVANDIFYLQNHFPVPRIDPKAYKLRVHGDAVEREIELSLDDLKKLPSVTLTRAVECGENGRVFFAVQYKKQMDGAQWRLGGVGVAEWTGVPMRAVLERARVKPGARDVMPVGLDGGQDFRNLSARPMPLDRAMADDTLLVYGMNGQDLPPDHGGPAGRCGRWCRAGSARPRSSGRDASRCRRRSSSASSTRSTASWSAPTIRRSRRSPVSCARGRTSRARSSCR